jgi:hypothetical protein
MVLAAARHSGSYMTGSIWATLANVADSTDTINCVLNDDELSLEDLEQVSGGRLAKISQRAGLSPHPETQAV